MAGEGVTLACLTFGHPSKTAAITAMAGKLGQLPRQEGWNEPLAGRLRAYAQGVMDDFLDVKVDLGCLTLFQRQVADCCRRIPPGTTRTYGQLAAEAGSPRAARAVGACMAANRIPLVIPCHRVIQSGGGLGGFSAPGGLRLKRRLLKLEAVCRPVFPPRSS